MTLEPGIHEISAETYHADPCDRPSLSSSIAHLLVTASPAHARAAHPKLNPELEREEESRFDLGTAVHALLLQGLDKAVVVDAPDWRTAAAKQQRDEARVHGYVPLLTEQWERVRAMEAAARVQLEQLEISPIPFTDGKPEQTLIWEEDDGVVCRARLDWLRDDHQAIDDFKSTSASAEPARWVRTMYGIGGDVQVAFYLRGFRKVFGESPAWRFVVQETFAPYALSVVDLAPSALAIANDKVEYAIQAWRRGIRDGVWPAYDRRLASLEIPTFEELRWLERDAA